MSTLTFDVGSEDWHEWRRKCTVSTPGRFSSLYYLNAKVLHHESVVPMTYEAHWAMCLFAEGMTGIKRIDSARVKMILVPRGVGKSTLITKALPIQQLLKEDNFACGIANEITDNAEAFLANIRTEFEKNELLRALFPERIPPDLKATTWRSDQIIIQRTRNRGSNPSVLAVGVGSTIAGKHLDMWICDDLLSRDAAEAARRGNFTEIEKTNNWMVQLEPTLSYPKRDPILVIGTRWWEGDTYERLEGDEDNPGQFGHGEPREDFRWTLRLPNGKTQVLHVYRRGEMAVFRRSIRDEAGNSFFPERYTNEELDVMEQQDPVFFASQYLLEPTAGGAAEFNQDQLKSYHWDGQHLVFRNRYGKIEHAPLQELVVVISVDPAFSDDNSAARTAIPVTATNGHEIFLLEDFAQRGMGVYDIANQVVDFCVRYKPRKVIVETVVGQVAVSDVLRRKAAEANVDLYVEELPSHGKKQKTWRIFGLEPYFQQGRFYMRAGQSNFLQEFLGFPRSAYRDLLDALAFQRGEWDRAANYASGGKGSNPWVKGNEEALARLRRAISRGGGY